MSKTHGTVARTSLGGSSKGSLVDVAVDISAIEAGPCEWTEQHGMGQTVFVQQYVFISHLFLRYLKSARNGGAVAW